MVIFGATGDLTKRKLLPALTRLKALKLLPETFNIVGLATRKLTDETYRQYAKEAIEKHSRHAVDKAALAGLLKNTHFISSSFEDPGGYERLVKLLADIDKECSVDSSRLFYMATQPSFFPVIIDKLAESGLSNHSKGTEHATKIIIEKPFGRDITSARALNDLALKHFDEEQVYRIDHYLGKETVQNILYFRFANGIYEPIWNRRYVDHIQITAAETIGVENRGGYFEEAGILRDMVQNHLLQLLTLVAMEPPISMDSESIRSKKIDLLDSIRLVDPKEVGLNTIRGQYGAGTGPRTNMYREEDGVAKNSEVETFVALKVLVDNWRWSGVPFYLRTGKRLKRNLTEIAIHFKSVPLCLFTETMTGCPDGNVLTLKIQPDEGIAFRFNVKRPGSANHMEAVEMDFSYKEAFAPELPEAYERLLIDCMLGDSTLFPHKAGIEASWKFITNILEGWSIQPPPKFPNYTSGSWGPAESGTLLARDARVWRNP
jgi:glucose-6-phosphate 1-dehydrogenase